MQQEWYERLVKVVPEEQATHYAAQFQKNFLPISGGGGHDSVLASITDQHLAEMGVAIGHRSIIQALFREIRMGPAPRRATIPAGHLPSTHPDNGSGGHPSTLTGDTPNSTAAVMTAVAAFTSLHNNVAAEGRPHDMEDDMVVVENKIVRVSNKGDADLTWISLSGERESAEALEREVMELRNELMPRFSSKFIERAFKDDGPMPFFLQDEDNNAVLLLRIPSTEDTAVYGTSIKTITNRIVLLLRDTRPQEAPLIVSYHRNVDNAAFRSIHRLWRVPLKKDFNNSTLSTTAKEFLYRFVMLYKEAISTLEARSEIAETDKRPEMVIEKLSLIQKQASVYARCLVSFKEVLRSAKGFAEFDHFAEELIEVASGLDAKAMELAENAETTINLKMALDGYRSGVNMKYFTYLSIVCQPVGIATGWFGMNFSNMPELAYENSYFIFCGCVLAVVIIISLSLYFSATASGELVEFESTDTSSSLKKFFSGDQKEKEGAKKE